jgi:phosphoserine phosphatase
VTQPQPHKPVVAAFDFDGTLTRHDSLFPFLLHIAGPVKLFNKIILLSPILAAYAVGLLRNDNAKEKVLHSFLAGMEMHRSHEAFSLAQATRPPLRSGECVAGNLFATMGEQGWL